MMKYTNNSYIFNLALLLSITFLLIYITDHYILTVNFYQNSGTPLSGIPGGDIQLYDSLQKWIYISSAIYLLIKLFMVSLVLYTALFLSDQQVRFKKVFNVAICAEFIFFIPAVIKICWFHYYYPNGSLNDWHRFYILSALTLFQYVPADYYYALQTVNLFEVGYWYLLAAGIHKITRLNYDRSLKMVIISYLPALFIWICVITFCSLLLFPATG